MAVQNRMEKRQQREDAILAAAGDLIADVGFFELKMSDLARMCGISVGTLYGHFASKEDLLLGLAVLAGVKRAALFDIARRHEGGAIEKFIVATLIDLRFSIDHPQLFEAEYLAMAPSIWKRATPARHQALLDRIDAATQMFQGFLAEGAGELGLSEAAHDPDHTRNFNLGSWGLNFGLNSLALSEISDRHYGQELRHNAIEIVCDNLADLLLGAGWNKTDARATLRDLAARYARPHATQPVGSY